ncbi:MAG: hypothetical protein K2X06_06945 [Burkholderiales bacterium]|nr:hypothetical protein [Burkholderiales bacterium]
MIPVKAGQEPHVILKAARRILDAWIFSQPIAGKDRMRKKILLPILNHPLSVAAAF